MRKTLSVFIFSFLFSGLLQAQETKKVLFIGNSYTYVNDLPGMLSSVAASFGDFLIHDSNTPGGYTFNAHSTNATTLNKIYSNDWDYVVLQEQSQLPSFSPSQVANDVYPYADSLNKFIQENDSCTRTMFYMTWGRKNGDASNCASYPPVCTYAGMQGRLRASYLEMANDLDAEVSPVGAVWKKFRTDFPSVELYNADESHPSLHGTYLAACTFYASIYHKSPAGAFVPVGISAQEASDIQNTVEEIVFDSLNIWRIDTTEVNADFSYTNPSGNTFLFTPVDSIGEVFYWDFGDGNFDTSYTSDPVSNDYDWGGNYPVTLIVIRKCDADTVTENLSVMGMNPIPGSETGFSIYPNPANENIFIRSDDRGEIFIFESTGRLIRSSEISRGTNRLDLSFLPNGIYLMELNSEGGTSNFLRLVKAE